MSQVQIAAKQLINTIQKFPKDKIKHIVSFKDTQIERFSKIAGIKTSHTEKKQVSMNDLKDIVNRTSGPLGLQASVMKKIQNGLANETMSVEMLNEQNIALQNLLSNKYKNYYEVGDKLYKPSGNPQYYERIMNEIEGKKKETFGSALRTVFFGK
ncbi:hypothetical protein TBLA_0F03100 [Henningerozyma blattae CBS 6284]|uniref:Uncharacterized protein n=1 Tax=Henningerozyma blattae (strain ATCC 34711 / CBS 6284 / DSM 70876 / NBRC 10599 / NRRL Y-10934 / UCD 77-7) TaxID=1071380 RepID=I2H647_HENB6|nr:hypothetical protein TBLA_0F03100 [Tetrapisispora blattae CBS 6284]CCH61849.1 hypothetical protein TBLA_0F03100 [Tetrapisispora blattae CBS 6284]